MTRPVTLSHALLGHQTLLRQAGLVIAGSALVAGAAQVSVPMIPVPMSLQTLAVSLIGLTYGARLAAITLLVYLAEGALGLPVFSNGAAGLAYLMGPTGGFLVGFVLMAFLTGWLVERGLGQGIARLFLAALVPAMLLYLPGVAWLTLVTPLDLSGAASAGALPFVLGDIVKSAVAALIIAGGWEALRRRGG
ncbi:biotin transporter BioY [Rhodobacteraceae bacterium WD3A24]|nr:biotin transporter BioY [Rhodobacteraceae bacterium WD3A24]